MEIWFNRITQQAIRRGTFSKQAARKALDVHLQVFRSLKSWGEKWQIRDIGDTAVLPLVALIGAIFFFVLTPINNTFTRTQEYEADMYGLNASRQPDGEAQADIHLGEYRKMSPGRVEEWIFYDHPSGRNRIYAAMRWKAENLQLFSAPPGANQRPR